jgi:hypothetical protein
MDKNQDISCGKMSQALSLQIPGMTSKPSSKQSRPSKVTMLSLVLQKENGQAPEKSWEMISVSPGDVLTRSFGEFPKEEDVSILSQILTVGVPEKYYLSQKACLGILRRASARGKELPELLKKALLRQASR